MGKHFDKQHRAKWRFMDLVKMPDGPLCTLPGSVPGPDCFRLTGRRLPAAAPEAPGAVTAGARAPGPGASVGRDQDLAQLHGHLPTERRGSEALTEVVFPRLQRATVFKMSEKWKTSILSYILLGGEGVLRIVPSGAYSGEFQRAGRGISGESRSRVFSPRTGRSGD